MVNVAFLSYNKGNHCKYTETIDFDFTLKNGLNNFHITQWLESDLGMVQFIIPLIAKA